MSSSRSIFTFLIVFVLASSLTACGGGGSSGGDDGDSNSTSSRISGEVTAPAGSIAQFDKKLNLLAALEFVIPSAFAEIIGLSPVANATVELIRIDSDGNQVGAVLATTSTDSFGAYSLELPVGLSASADLLVQIRDSSGQPVLRAIVSGDSVNIDPVSHFILDSLINEPGLVLANLDISKVQTLIDQISAIDIPLSALTIQDAINEIQTLAPVTNSVAAFVNQSFVVGAWTVDGSEPLMLVLFTDGRYIHWQDCTNSGDGAGVEYGTYVYDGTLFTATQVFDQNGGCGLTDWQSFPVTVDSVQLSFGTGQNSGTLSRAWNNDPDSILGGWDIRDNPSQPGAIVFDANGNYIVYQPAGADEQACPQGGVEYGTYNFNGTSATGSIVFDENNDCGLGEGTGSFSFPNIAVANNSITFSDGGGSVSFDRVEFRTGDFMGGPGDPGPGEGGSSLPVANIVIDGDATDWTSVPAITSDPQGDQNGNDATDLVSAKAAVDGSQFYLLMETQGDIALPHTPTQDYSHYEFGIHFYTDAQCGQELGFFIANNFTSSTGENFHLLDSYVNGYSGFPTQFEYLGSFLETSFDLLALPTEATHVAFNPYIQSFGTNNILHDDLGSGVFGCYALP